MSQTSNHFNRRGPASTLNFILSEFHPTCMFSCDVSARACTRSTQFTHKLRTHNSFHFIYRYIMSVCVCVCENVSLHSGVSLSSGTLRLALISTQVLSMVLVPKLRKITSYYCGLLLFSSSLIQNSIPGWFFRKREITIRDKYMYTFDQIQFCICTFLVPADVAVA